MDVEQFIRDTVPDFMDVEVSTYEEERGEKMITVVRIEAEHDGQLYASEIAENNREIPNSIYLKQIKRSYRVLIEEALSDEVADRNL